MLPVKIMKEVIKAYSHRKKKKNGQSVMAHIINPSTWEVEAI